MIGYVWAVIAVVFNATANLSLSGVLKGARLGTGEVSVSDLLSRCVTSPLAYIGGFAAILSMATWAMALSHLPLSRAIPILSVMFIIVPICSHFLYGDDLSIRILLSSILIAIGVSLSVSIP